MSSLKIALRLSGTLPTQDVLEYLLPLPFRMVQQGSRNRFGQIQLCDVVSLPLAQWDHRDTCTPDHVHATLMEAAVHLQHVTPGLAQLDDTALTKEIYISTVRTTDQGGFVLPSAFIEAASRAQLPIAISIAVVLDDEVPIMDVR